MPAVSKGDCDLRRTLPTKLLGCSPVLKRINGSSQHTKGFPLIGCGYMLAVVNDRSFALLPHLSSGSAPAASLMTLQVFRTLGSVVTKTAIEPILSAMSTHAMSFQFLGTAESGLANSTDATLSLVPG
jgi:hypothetical protein